MMSRVSLLALAGLLVLASPALGQDADQGTAEEEEAGGWVLFPTKSVALLSATIGAALVIMAGAGGISRIGGNAVESMARQPEAAGTINTAMLIAAAMIEGATLFGVLGCFLAIQK